MLIKIRSNHDGVHTAHMKKDIEDKKVFGFWIYLMSDFILFAILIATYLVLQKNVVNGPSGKEIFELGFILIETFLLLASSFTCSMVVPTVYRRKKKLVNIWLSLTFLFGLCFISMELYEFYHLITKGYSPNRSAFLSSFFTLVGAHGLHVISGLIWILVMMFHVYYHGLNFINQIRLQCLSLFWHFLDVIWIFVFTLVYLMGSL